MTARNTVLSALKNVLVSAFPGASVLRTASDPDKYMYDIPIASWPTSTKPLLVIQGDSAVVNKDEKTGLTRPRLQTHTVKIHCYVSNANPASRDDALGTIVDSLKTVLRSNHTLSDNVSVAMYREEKIKDEESSLVPPYGGSEILLTIIH